MDPTKEQLDRIEAKLDRLLEQKSAKRPAGKAEMVAYARDKGIDPALASAWFDDMASQGWMKNGGRTPILDRKATLRMWHNRGWLKKYQTQGRRPGDGW